MKQCLLKSIKEFNIYIHLENCREETEGEFEIFSNFYTYTYGMPLCLISVD
jgi:hypothetical protein